MNYRAGQTTHIAYKCGVGVGLSFTNWSPDVHPSSDFTLARPAELVAPFRQIQKNHSFLDKRMSSQDIQRLHFELLELMKRFHMMASDHGILYGIEGGTLLGAVRERGIIAHDDDIDLYIMEDS